MQESDKTENNTTSGDEKMPDITSLIQQLSNSYGWWANASQWLIGITAVVTLLYFGASYKALKKAGDLQKAQDALSKAKDEQARIHDEQVTSDLKDKELKIGQANERAANADERAGKANERAEEIAKENVKLRTDLENATAESRAKQAELAREQTKLVEGQRKAADAQRKADEARIALENLLRQRTEPRTLTAEQRARLIKIFRAYSEERPERYGVGLGEGPSVTVTYIQGNDESTQYALQFVEVFREAGWQLWGQRGLPALETSPTFSGLDVSQNGADSQMLDFVRSALREAGLFATGNVTMPGGNKALGEGSFSNVPLPSARWRAGGDIILAVGLRP